MTSSHIDIDLFPDYSKNYGEDTAQRKPAYRSAIEDSSFSPEVKAKVNEWHGKAASMLDALDAMLARRKAQVDPLLSAAEQSLDEARAILATIRVALAEALDGGDPLGEAVRRVQARLPPHTPAAAEAVCDLSDTEISAVRALKLSPPPAVRTVVCVVCSILKLGSRLIADAPPSNAAAPVTRAGPLPLASWEEAQALLANKDFAKALKGYDPRALHAHLPTATSLKARLASLGASGGSGSSGRGPGARKTLRGAAARATAAAALPGSSSIGGVAETLMLNVAVRSGGRAVGALYLWAARVLAHAEALREEEELEKEQEVEAEALAGVLGQAQMHLDEAQRRLEQVSSSSP